MSSYYQSWAFVFRQFHIVYNDPSRVDIILDQGSGLSYCQHLQIVCEKEGLTKWSTSSISRCRKEANQVKIPEVTVILCRNRLVLLVVFWKKTEGQPLGPIKFYQDVIDFIPLDLEHWALRLYLVYFKVFFEWVHRLDKLQYEFNMLTFSTLVDADCPFLMSTLGRLNDLFKLVKCLNVTFVSLVDITLSWVCLLELSRFRYYVLQFRNSCFSVACWFHLKKSFLCFEFFWDLTCWE